MTSKLSIVLAFLLFAACHPFDKQVTEPVEGPSSELTAIDSLMWQQPDSALTCLMAYFDSCRDVSRNVSEYTTVLGDVSGNVSTVYNHHYANLLLAELLYKNDYAQTNRPELLRAVDYFDSLCLCTDVARNVSTDPIIVFLDARAHYINGVGYYENDSVVEACKEYLKALDVMEEKFEEKDLVGHKARFVALTYTRLSMLFSDMYLHEQAIYFAQLTLSLNQKLEVPNWHIARMLCEVGIHYDIMEQLDSADYYYKNAAIVLNDTNCLLFKDIASQQVFLSYKKNGLQENTLTQFHLLLNEAKSEMEYLSRCLSIGEVFYHEKQLDSAWIYLSKVYNNTISIASKKQAAEWMVEICKAQGRDDEILEYASFLVPFANQEENQSEIKSQLTELYNAYRQANLSRQHQKAINKNVTIRLVIICGLITGLLVYVFLYHRNKKRKQLLEIQIKEEQHSHDMKQKALSGRLKQSNQKLQETLKLVEDQEEKHNIITESNTSYSTFDERYEAFRQSPICSEILVLVNNLHSNKRNIIKTNSDITEYKAFALSLSQTAQLTKTVEVFFPNLYTTLKAKYATFDRKEWLHCCLYLMQLDKMSICVLLQEPYYTCRRYTLKLEEAFGCRHGLTVYLIEQSEVC